MGAPDLTVDVERVLLANRERFLAFLSKRTPNREAAEELFQSAILRALEKGLPEADEQGAVAWFYRVLRNALVDEHRRADARSRSLDALAAEPAPPDAELEATICACVNDLIPTLKGEYAELVRAVDLEGRAVSDVARELGITPNNAMVRLHRARRALKASLVTTCGTCAANACLDCGCKRVAIS